MTNPAYHLVGIGGIGMSGLAQMLAAAGNAVSGSDRALQLPENAELFAALQAQGIQLFTQDGSYLQTRTPDAIIYSTAIEEDNPDFLKAPAAVKRLHRAEALAAALKAWPAKKRISVTGSAGKTTVSAWLGESLERANCSSSLLCGGLLNRFRTPRSAGNFVQGQGDFFVFEADESDKSLVRYTPELTVLLNVGTDHYSREELLEVFARALRQTHEAAVVEYSVLEALPNGCADHLRVLTFSADNPEAQYMIKAYRFGNGSAEADLKTPEGVFTLKLPIPGIHNAVNALAVLAAMNLCGIESKKALEAIEKFSGVWRRFDFAGRMPCGALVYDDYAHNLEKMASAMRTAREQCGPDGHLIVAFQPHGFGPLSFMRAGLLKLLRESLTAEDIFLLLPVYYAGGTSSFKPTSSEVCEDLLGAGLSCTADAPLSRDEAEALIRLEAKSADVVLVMGARDNSLPLWAKRLTEKEA